MPSTRTVPAIGWTRILVTIGVLILLSAVQGSAQTGAAGQAATGATDRAMSAEAAARLESVQAEMVGGEHTFSVGYSPAMEYTIDQLCGLKEPEGWRDTARFAEFDAPAETLPSSYDWRQPQLGGVTPIKNQLGCGSCWAFGTVGPLESQIKLKCGIVEDIAEQYLVSCNVSGWSCGGGWWAHNYHKVGGSFDHGNETESGGVRESGFPYKASNAACQGPHSHSYKLSSWGYVLGSSTIPSVQAIKQAIKTYGPVGAAVCVGGAFQGYDSGVFNADETSACADNGGINHAIVLVGWNDNGDAATKGYWILRNSWGTGWGENGYMNIRYGVSNVGYAANFVEFDSANCAGISIFDCAQAVVLSAANPYDGTTGGSSSKATQYGPNGSFANNQTGPEVVHRFVSASPGDITATLTNLSADLHVFILNACDPYKTLAGGGTTHTITNAPAGTYYMVVDGADPAGGSYTLTVTKICTSAPSAPTSITYPIKDADGTFKVSWSMVSDATSYTVQHADAPSFADAVTVYQGVATHYAAKVKSGTHYYRVLAENDCGQSGSTTGDAVVVPPPSIKVRTPNGDKTFAAGGTRTIGWTYTGDPGAWVKIQLLKGDKAVRTITRKTAIGSNGKGSFVWIIPSRLAPGSEYRVKITSRTDSTLTDTSDDMFGIHK